MPKLIIFDYNGVLVNDPKIHEDLYVKLAGKYNPKLTREKFQKIINKPTIEKIKLILENRKKPSVEELKAEKEEMYIKIARERGVMFSEARKVLKDLSKNHVLAMVSNSTRNQIFSVFPRDLLDKFKMILTYEDVDKPKPDPSSLKRIMNDLAIITEETVYVGDAPSDMQAAKNANIRAIGIDTGTNSEKELVEAGADEIIHSLGELDSVID